eukprot:Sspe_Gene.96405::Locus_69085_Transcript_1_1_Confidence_1.000_Length_1814::g.96405::m.96405
MDSAVRADPELIANIRKGFAAVDVGGTGQIASWELPRVLQDALPVLPDAKMREVVSLVLDGVDPEGTDTITLDNLTAYLLHRNYIKPDTMVKVPSKEVPTTPFEWCWAVLEGSDMYRSKSVRNCSVAVMVVLQLVITLSVVNVLVASTIPDLSDCPDDVVQCDESQVKLGNFANTVIEGSCVVIFTVELLIRLAYPRPFLERFFNVWVVIDVLAVLPFYLMITGVVQGGATRILLILRVLRMVKVLRILNALDFGPTSVPLCLITTAVERSLATLVWMGVLIIMILVFFASLSYYIEREGAEFNIHKKEWRRPPSSSAADAGRKLTFQSIPDAMWWVLVTITSVGYGDMIPATAVGRAVGSLCIVIGLLILAYPITILASVFQECMEEHRQHNAEYVHRLARRTKAIRQLNFFSSARRRCESLVLTPVHGRSQPPSSSKTENPLAISGCSDSNSYKETSPPGVDMSAVTQSTLHLVSLLDAVQHDLSTLSDRVNRLQLTISTEEL